MAKAYPKLTDFHTITFDFDGVFTDNKVYLDQHGCETVMCDRADGLGFDFLRKTIAKQQLDIETFILSKEENPVVLARAKKLQLTCYHGIQNKAHFMDAHLKNKDFKGLLYIGNDLNDLQIMIKAGCSIAPLDSHSKILEIASFVSNKKGGQGFLREVIEHLLGIPNMPTSDLCEFLEFK